MISIEGRSSRENYDLVMDEGGLRIWENSQEWPHKFVAELQFEYNNTNPLLLKWNTFVKSR
jgi:hypothetical protein